MDRLPALAPNNSERNAALDHCLAGIDRLSHEVKDASSYLPAYDQRTYSAVCQTTHLPTLPPPPSRNNANWQRKAIKALSEKLQTIRTSSNPPKKFAFKSRSKNPATPSVKNASALPPADAAELAAGSRAPFPIASTNPSTAEAPTPQSHLSPSLRSAQEAPSPTVPPRSLSISPTTPTICITNHTNLSLTLPSPPPGGAVAQRTATLSHLTACSIDLSPATTSSPLAALYLKDLADSAVATGRVEGAVHLTTLTGCTLFVATRQFRMHGARDVDVYLQCGSRPIVEGCVGVRFAPLPGTLREAWGIEREGGNLWDQVDDFGWLKAERSPNWSVLPEGERVQGLVDVVRSSEEL